MNSKMYKSQNSAKSFSYAGNSKDFGRVVYPTLDGMAVSAWYVSSMPAVLNAKLKNQLRRM